MERLIDDAIKDKNDGSEEGRRWSRFLQALKARLLVGTGVETAPIPAGIWLERLQFMGSLTQSRGFIPAGL